MGMYESVFRGREKGGTRRRRENTPTGLQWRSEEEDRESARRGASVTQKRALLREGTGRCHYAKRGVHYGLLWRCTKPEGHEDQHENGIMLWHSDSPLSVTLSYQPTANARSTTSSRTSKGGRSPRLTGPR